MVILNITKSFVCSIPLVTIGISGPTVAMLVVFTAFHPVNGGKGHASCATVSPASTNFDVFCTDTSLPMGLLLI